MFVVGDPHLHACLEVSFHTLNGHPVPVSFLSVRIVLFGTVAILYIIQRLKSL